MKKRVLRDRLITQKYPVSGGKTGKLITKRANLGKINSKRRLVKKIGQKLSVFPKILYFQGRQTQTRQS